MKYNLKILPVFIYLIIVLILFVTKLENIKPDISHVVGIFLTSMAFVLWIVSRFQLGEAFSLKPKAKYLVTKGIYSKIRHPVYVFSSLAFLGVAIFLRNHYVFLLLLLFVIIQIIRIKKEEQALLKKFGNKYINYKRKTWL